MNEGSKPVRLVLKFEDWPYADQKQWAALTASGTLFDDGPFASWSAGTARFRRQGYGQWLSYLARHHPQTLGQAPPDRITERTVRGFVEECRARLKGRSTHNLITSVLVLAMALAPDRDWQWLQRVQARLRLGMDDSALAARAPISAFDIFEWSLGRLKEVESLDYVTDFKRAIQFREALMIGFLIARPVRRRADAMEWSWKNLRRSYLDGTVLSRRPFDR